MPLVTSHVTASEAARCICRFQINTLGHVVLESVRHERQASPQAMVRLLPSVYIADPVCTVPKCSVYRRAIPNEDGAKRRAPRQAVSKQLAICSVLRVVETMPKPDADRAALEAVYWCKCCRMP